MVNEIPVEPDKGAGITSPTREESGSFNPGYPADVNKIKGKGDVGYIDVLNRCPVDQVAKVGRPIKVNPIVLSQLSDQLPVVDQAERGF